MAARALRSEARGVAIEQNEALPSALVSQEFHRTLMRRCWPRRSGEFTPGFRLLSDMRNPAHHKLKVLNGERGGGGDCTSCVNNLTNMQTVP